MQENSTTPDSPQNLLPDRRPFHLKFKVGGRLDNTVQPDENADAIQRALFFQDALLWLMQQVSPQHLEFENETDIASMLNFIGELGGLLGDLAGHHAELLDSERGRLGTKLDSIQNIINKTRAVKGDAAEIADDQAVMMIRDLLQEKEGNGQ